MSIEFDSFTNRGEYLSAHYFAEELGTSDLARRACSPDGPAARPTSPRPRRTPRATGA